MSGLKLQKMQKILNIINKSYKYLIASLIVIVPLYPKFPFIQIPGTYVSIRFEDFLLAILAIVTFIKLISNIKTVFENKITRAILLFLLVGVVSLVSGILVTQTVGPSIGILHLLRRVEYFVPFFAVLAFFPYEKGKSLDFYVKVLVIVVFVAFLYGVGQKYFGLPVIMTQNSESSKGIALRWTPGSQTTSTFAGHYDLASYMVLVLPILISLIFVVKDKLSKIILSVVSLSGYWLLINTASRISLVSYLVAVCVSLFLMKKTKAIFIVVILSLALSAFSPSLFARYKSLIDVYSQKVKNMKIVNVNVFDISVLAQEITPMPSVKPIIEDRSTSIRLNIEWPRAIRSFYKNPLLGLGYSSIGLASDNDYLRLLAEVGVLGFLGFMLILIRIMMVFASALPFPKKMSGVKLGFVAGVTGGFFGSLINATFIDVFEASKFAIAFWLLIGMAVFLIKETEYEQQS